MIFTNFSLPESSSNLAKVNLLHDLKPGLTLFKDVFVSRQLMTAFLIANPSTSLLIQLGLMRLFRVIPCHVFVFDLILKNPNSKQERIIAIIKGFFISMLDYIIGIHKDTSGYERAYRIGKAKFLYVPFKANNFASKDEIVVSEGDYVVALGASQRDYQTLIEAARYTNEKIIIVCSDDNARRHNADVGNDEEYPPNISRIRETLDSQAWYNYLAWSKLVVIPILESAIQPAGVSVYLESMILKKPVIISTGASTNFILEHEREAILVPPGDPRVLGQAISRLACDASLRNQIAQAGYEYALSLGDDGMLRKNILELIVRNSGAGN